MLGCFLARGPLCDIFGIGGAAGGIAEGAGSVAAAGIQASAANHAADLQSQAAQNALGFQKDAFNTQQQNIAPWLQAGKGALNQLTEGTQPGGNLIAPYGQQFSFNAVNEQNDPGYQFRLQQGQQALERAQAATGNSISGGALKAAQRYGQNYASGEYQNAYNRALNNYQTNYNAYQTNQANQFNRLASIAGLGQNANSQLGQASQNFANQAGNYLTQGANAGAAGIIGSGNAIGNGIAGAANAFQNYNALNAINGSGYRNPPAESYFNGPDDLSNSLNALSGGL